MSTIGGFGGGVTLLSGANCDFNAWSMRISQDVGDTTKYDTVPASSHRGSGTIDFSLTARGLLISNSPGFTSSVFKNDGGACTLTAKTGCTFAGNFILSGGSIDHARRNPSQPVSYEGINDGPVTETWAVS
jgi:hypothetical protein